MEKRTDEELMIAVAGDDLDGMRVLYDRYYKWVYNFFIQLIQDKDASADLAQSTFYKAIKYRKSYNGGKFDSWIFKIARNLSSDYFKTKKGRINLEAFENIPEDDTRNDVNEEVIKLKLVMQKLAAEDRELLIMSRFQEMKYSQIAEILGSTENAIKIKAHRALKKLRTLFFESVEI